jgi:hypothetical protein
MNIKRPLETDQADTHSVPRPHPKSAKIMEPTTEYLWEAQTALVKKDATIPSEVPVTDIVSASQSVPMAKGTAVARSVQVKESVSPNIRSGEFAIPLTVHKLRSNMLKPWTVGYFIGLMLYHISPLLTRHLENSMDFHNPVPKALSSVCDFVSAVDAYIVHLRLIDGCSEKFPNDDRKTAKHRRKYIERCTYMVEAVFKNYIREVLGDIFQAWSSDQTRLFNKGADKALTGIQWVVYPDKNVVFEAIEGDWAVWIRGQCEELGMYEARAGRKVLEEM